MDGDFHYLHPHQERNADSDHARKIIAHLTETVQANALEIADLRAKLVEARRVNSALKADCKALRSNLSDSMKERDRLSEMIAFPQTRPLSDVEERALDIIKRAAAKLEAGVEGQ